MRCVNCVVVDQIKKLLNSVTNMGKFLLLLPSIVNSGMNASVEQFHVRRDNLFLNRLGKTYGPQ